MKLNVNANANDKQKIDGCLSMPYMPPTIATLCQTMVDYLRKRGSCEEQVAKKFEVNFMYRSALFGLF